MDFGKGSVVEWGLQSQGIDTKKYKREAGEKIADNPIKSGAMLGGGLVGGFGALLGVDGARNKNLNTVYQDQIMKMEAKQDKLLNADVDMDQMMKNHDKSHKLFKKTMAIRNNPEQLLKSPKYNLLQTKSALKGAVPMAALGAGLGAVYGDTTNKTVQEFKHATTESFGLIKIAEEEMKERDWYRRPVEGTAGALLVNMSLDKAIGAEKFHHGTSFDNAEKIKEQGFLANKGGSGVTSSGLRVGGNQEYVHGTKWKSIAKNYAKSNHPDALKDMELVRVLEEKMTDIMKEEDWLSNEESRRKLVNAREEMSKALDTFHENRPKRPLKESGEVITGRVPYELFDRAEIDTRLGNSKSTAFKTKENIPVEAIRGSSATTAERAKYYGKNFANYAKDYPGRLALGLGGVGLGGVMVADSFLRDKEMPLGDRLVLANTESFGLSKIAEEDKDRKTGKRVIEGAGGAALAAGSIGAATGTEKFYHGTSFENAKDIKQHGLLANKGGTGAAKDLGVPQYVDNSQGYVHATKFKPNATMYAKMNHPDSQKDLEKVRGLRNKIQEVDQSQFGSAVDEFTKENRAMQSRMSARKLSESGEVLKGRVPYDLFQRAEIDKDSGGSKIMAFKTKENIPVEAIHGSSATLGQRAKYYGKNFAGYAKNHTGRLALGLGGVGLGTALVGDSLLRDKEKPIAGTLKLASTNYDERMIQNKMRRTGCSREEVERTMDIADSQYLSEVFMDDFVNKLTGGKR